MELQGSWVRPMSCLDVMQLIEGGQVERVALDIGGTLSKISCITNTDGEEFHLQTFPTQKLSSFLAKIKEIHKDKTNGPTFTITGGGAQKYRTAITDSLGEKVQQVDEMQALGSGVVAALEKKCFSFDTSTCSIEELSKVEEEEFVVVNVGSGISIIKAGRSGVVERITGTSIGGSTLVGLMRHCYGHDQSFHDIVVDCISGDYRNVDLLVGDIYGTDYLPGLSSDIVASSLGKVSNGKHKREDIASSILHMIVNNFTQLAWLVSGRVASQKIVFTGSFFEGEGQVFRELTGRGLMHWDPTLSAIFIPHSGFTTSIGALILDNNENI